MRSIFILLLLSKMDISFAQKSDTLQGKWKIISIAEVTSVSLDSLCYDLEKDSIHIPAEDIREAYKDGHDSIFTVNLFKSMYQSFKGSSFTFSKDTVVFETRSDKVKGTYRIKNKNTLDMLLAYDGREQEHYIYTYFFKEDMLHLVINKDFGYSKFILKKE